MLKKTLILLAMLLPLGVSAQLGVGTWEVMPVYQNADQMVQTDSKVYCLSSGTLYSYDFDNEESYTYGMDNVLSETGISNIYYNRYGKYLAIVYPSGTIDLLYDNGKVVCIPDIKDAVLTTSRQIKDIAFAKDKMFILTNFGLVLYDDAKHQVVQSGIYSSNIAQIAVNDNYLAVWDSNTKKYGFMPINGKFNFPENFDWIYSEEEKDCKDIVGYGTDKFLLMCGWRTFLIKYDPANHTFGYEKDTQPYKEKAVNTQIQPMKNGFFVVDNANSKIYTYGDDSTVGEITIPAAIKGQTVTLWDNLSVLSVGDKTGFGQYDLSNNTQSSRIKPESLTFQKVGTLYKSPSGKIYVAPRRATKYFEGDWPQGGDIANINIIENGKIRDVTPVNLTLVDNNSIGAKDGGKSADFGGVVEDPLNPDIFYMSSWRDHLYKIKDGQQLAVYKNDNSIFNLYGGYGRFSSIDFDGHNNFIVSKHDGLSAPNMAVVYMLDGNKLQSGDVAADNWSKILPNSVESGSKDLLMFACKKSNIVFYTRPWLYALIIVDTKGTVATNDDTMYIWKGFTDQDGKEISLGGNAQIGAIHEDPDGNVWIGYDRGVFMIDHANLQLATSPSMRVNHIKVPRNDGTGFADYLLDGEFVLDIAEDGAGRKWFATESSGVYLTSKDGSQIIEHYDTSNSLLPTNKIYAVACDDSNGVYFGTTLGLTKYNSTASPGADNYSDVYAYPNPVRPDYTGWITVAGLMDNSFVMITDSAGNTFYKGRSEGGMFTWDGCNSAGERVKTGVYYVLASQTEGSESVVTKILVVK